MHFASAAGYFVMEAICRHSFYRCVDLYDTENHWFLLITQAFIFTSSLIVYLFRRRAFWRVLVSVVLADTWQLSTACSWLNRVTPFTGPDLHLITDAMTDCSTNICLLQALWQSASIVFGILSTDSYLLMLLD